MVVNYLGRFLDTFNKLWLQPWALTITQVGIYGGIHDMAFLLARLDLGQGVIRYGTRLSEDKKEQAAFLSWVFVASTTFYLLLLGIFIIIRSYLVSWFSNRSPEVLSYFPTIIVSGYIILLNVTLKAWHVARGRMVLPNFLQHIALQCFTALTLICYGWSYCSLHQFLLMMSLPYLANLSILLIDLVYRGELHFCLDTRFFAHDFVRSFVVYSFFTVINSSMVVIMTLLDKLMVLAICGNDIGGAYRVAVVVANLLDIPIKVAKQASARYIVRFLSKHDYQGLAHFYQRITLMQFIFSSFLFVLLYIHFDSLLYLFSRQATQVALVPFVLLGIAKVLDNLFNISNDILTFSRHFKMGVITTLLIPLGILANRYLLHKMGASGAALATMVLVGTSGLINHCLVGYHIGIYPYTHKLLVAFVIAVLAFGIQYALPVIAIGWLDSLTRTLVLVGLYAVLLLASHTSLRFNNLMRSK